MMFTARSPSLFENDPRWKVVSSTRHTLGPRTGVLPSQALHALIERSQARACLVGIALRGGKSIAVARLQWQEVEEDCALRHRAHGG